MKNLEKTDVNKDDIISIVNNFYMKKAESESESMFMNNKTSHLVLSSKVKCKEFSSSAEEKRFCNENGEIDCFYGKYSCKCNVGYSGVDCSTKGGSGGAEKLRTVNSSPSIILTNKGKK